MCSSKWLVFIRSLLAGFDRSLTANLSRFRRPLAIGASNANLITGSGTIRLNGHRDGIKRKLNLAATKTSGTRNETAKASRRNHFLSGCSTNDRNDMRRHRRKRNYFMELTLTSLGALVIGISMMRFFANVFGEIATQAIPMMSAVLTIPALLLVIGIIGWVWSEYSNWQDR